jgi:cytochrome c oxidase cbb3-type subunit 3
MIPVLRRIGILTLVTSAGMAVAAAIGYVREPRVYRTDPPVSAALDNVLLMPGGISGAPPKVYFALNQPYEKSGFDLSQGKRLYAWFGCSACHGDGRGGSGPSLIDGWWYYGPSMVSIVSSIRDGRPHGMPAFRGKLTSDQTWQLAGYVKALGSYSPSVVSPSRNDDRTDRPAENRSPASILFDEGPQPIHLDQGPSP